MSQSRGAGLGKRGVRQRRSGGTRRTHCGFAAPTHKLREDIEEDGEDGHADGDDGDLGGEGEGERPLREVGGDVLHRE